MTIKALLRLAPLCLCWPCWALDRIEPPHWWVGMVDPGLQLMLHGDAIAALQPQLDYPGVRLLGTQRSNNPNYLFVDLHIDADAQPGEFALTLLDAAGAPIHQFSYRLHGRAERSRQRRGFGAGDVIYLLVPDRYANGNPANDTIDSLREAADRSNPGGRHGGDLAGMTSALDYIADMGFTQIWSTPLLINDQPSYSYHGYAATDLYRIDPRYGSNEDYRRFVAAAAARGIGVIQDIVLNHIGSEHWWMADPPAADWINNGGRFAPTTHMRTTLQDPYAAASDRREFSDGWFVQTMPDMNQRNAQLANYLIQNTLWWIEYTGISGIREDTYSYADPQFLSDWSARVMAEYPQFSIVGEEWSRNPLVVSHWQAGNAKRTGYASSTAAMMDFPLYYELLESLNQPQSWDGGLTRLYAALVNDRLYANPSKMVLFEGNHDTSRVFTVLGEDLGRYRAAMVYLLTMPRTPQLFYGSEVLMTSPLQRDDGRLRGDFPGGWAGDAVNAFSGEGLSEMQRQNQTWLRRLLRWRKDSPVIHAGRLTHYAPRDGVYVYFRQLEEALVMVALNRSGEDTELAMDRFAEVLGSRRSGTEIGAGSMVAWDERLELPKDAAWIVELP